MKIEVLYFNGCPSFPKAMDQVKSVLHEEGMDAAIETVPVENGEDALAHRFLGSPTIRVNGLDVEVQSRGREDFGLKCRLYGSGRNLVGIPDTNLIRTAIREGKMD
ncbi:hypothetical protein [Candidatus Nitronereus thalassa]|uniref:DUF2703 domain-containing protein n=1 Tax=Candidatus Nitronereus thalassa TaxID=3020898 RepID=A0ABU3KB72_9BACT|nr:hypothetical protein [Candidatus Nitronereus thalassa]MDT7043686.1 hypothetical protein [Candidatus Nitronereus thalassa]